MNLFPPLVDDYVAKEDPVRVYDAFVEAVDFKELGISIEPYKKGAHEYYPKDMLKLLIYGYSYGIRSSRKLERACHHNLSFIWLMGDLKPDYRTIARFRAEYKESIKKMLKQCVHMCIKLDLIEGNALFIDGSPFRANASIKKTWTKERCEKHLKQLSSEIDKLVDESVNIDREEDDKDSLVKVKKELSDKLELKNKIQEIKQTLEEKPPKSQHNTVDPDCVKTRSRQATYAGYNAQVAVDGKHGLIVHTEALSHNQDYNKFNDQLNKATKVLEKKPRFASSDCGYYSLEDIKKVDKDVTVVMPSIKQSQKEKNFHPLKPFDKEHFKYNPSKDEYTCPEGKTLRRYSSPYSKAKKLTYGAEPGICQTCPSLKQCTTSSRGRHVTHTGKETLKTRLQAVYLSPKGQEIYKLRKEKAELPFGHMKRNLGALQFMLRGKAKVDAELSLLSTCFNIARMTTIIGASALLLKLKGA
jgi:transposase